MNSSKSSTDALVNQINAISDVSTESAHNISDLLADLSSAPGSPSSSNSSPLVSDEHILDILDDSNISLLPEEDDDIFNNSNSDLSISGMISPKSSSGISCNSSDAESFLTAFNARYDMQASTLFDVLDIIDSMVRKNKHTSTPKVIVDTKQVEALKTENAKLQSENEQLKFNLTEAKSHVSNLEHQVSNLKSTNSTLTDTNSSLQKDMINLKQALDSMHELMENHLDEVTGLSQQRTQLVELSKKQDQCVQQLEQIVRAQHAQQPVKKQPEQPVQQTKKANDNTDDLYTILSSITRNAEENISEDLMNRLHQIRDESRTPLRERIILIFKEFTKEFAHIKQAGNQQISMSEQAEQTIKMYHHKCLQILSMFEEELNFLQKLSHSSDLQCVVFAPQKISENFLSEENKSELIRKCAQLGRYIEETIGVISSEKFEETFEAPDQIDPTNVFDLLQTNQIESKLAAVVNRVGDLDNIDVRQLVDLFASQVYINDLLKNHTSELRLRLAHCGHELASLRQELDQRADIDAQEQEIQKELKRYERKDTRIRKLLSKYVEASPETSTITLVKSLVSGLATQVAKQSPLVEENQQLKKKISEDQEMVQAMQQEVQRLHESTKNFDEQKQKALEQQTEHIQKQLDDLQIKYKAATKENESQKQEIKTLTRENAEKQDKLDIFIQQIDETEKSHETAIQEANGRLQTASEQINAMTKQISEFEQIFGRVKKQRAQLGKQIERLQLSNEKLKESLEQQSINMQNQCDDQIREMQTRIDRISTEKDELNSQIQILASKNQQMSSEMAALNIAKKSLELKLRTMDERMNLEKSNLQSKASAQINASNIEQSKKLNELKKQIDEATIRISEIANIDQPSTLAGAIDGIEHHVQNLRQAQSLYVEMLDDVTEAQKIANAGPNTKIAEIMRELVSKNILIERTIDETDKKSQSERQELEKAKKELKRNESQMISLKQWESWGKRIHRVIHESESVHLSSDELRLALEEALLASVSHRSVFFRIESLRSQKSILQRFDRRLLMTKQIPKAGMTQLMIICIFSRRLQKMAGCLPLGLPPTDQSQFSERHQKHVAETPKAKSKPRKTPRSVRGKTSCKSPLRPLLPVWV